MNITHLAPAPAQLIDLVNATIVLLRARCRSGAVDRLTGPDGTFNTPPYSVFTEVAGLRFHFDGSYVSVSDGGYVDGATLFSFNVQTGWYAWDQQRVIPRVADVLNRAPVLDKLAGL